MTTAIRERPILFLSGLGCAIHHGRKTQTRRVVDPQPFAPHLGYMMTSPGVATLCGPDFPDGDNNDVACPYGKPGDRLWVRESWAVGKNHDHIKPRDLYPRSDGRGLTVVYADGSARDTSGDWTSYNQMPTWLGKWRKSIFMPRWACRSILEITDIRVEQLEAISEAEAQSEGFSTFRVTARLQFAELWDKLNANRGYPWGSDPWVWVVSFRRINEP